MLESNNGQQRSRVATRSKMMSVSFADSGVAKFGPHTGMLLVKVIHQHK